MYVLVSKEMTGKCKRSLKFSRNDQIIANSGYSAACPVLLGRLSVFSSSGSTSLLALDAILAHSMLAPDEKPKAREQSTRMQLHDLMTFVELETTFSDGKDLCDSVRLMWL